MADDLTEYRGQGRGLSRRAKGLLEAAMDEPVDRSILPPELRRRVPKGMSWGDCMDRVRGGFTKVPVDVFAGYVSAVPGWTVENRARQPEAGQGDRVFDVRPAAGRPIPVFLHGAVTNPFDRTDPALEPILADAAKARRRALVMPIVPLFKILHDAEGRIRRLLVFGGWSLEGGIWTPFLLAPGGPDDIQAQARYFRSDQVSRGLFRDRGLDGEFIRQIGELAEVVDSLKRRDFPDRSASRQGPFEPILLGAPGGWSQLASSAVAETAELLEKPFAPDDGGAPLDLPGRVAAMGGKFDIRKLAPRPIIELVERQLPGPGQADAMLAVLVEVTNGFTGLDDASCANIAEQDIQDLVEVIPTRVDPLELAGAVQQYLGWEIVDVPRPGADDEDESGDGESAREEGAGEEGGGEEGGDGGPAGAAELLAHGDYLMTVACGNAAEPLPVFLFGKRLHHDDANDDFAWFAFRRDLEVRLGGKAALVLTANLCFWSDAPPHDRPPERSVLAGAYAYDGKGWFPVALRRGSPAGLLAQKGAFDPNRVTEATLERFGMSGVDAMAMAVWFQIVLEAYRAMGPGTPLRRNLQPTDLVLQCFSDSWWFPTDQARISDFVEEEADDGDDADAGDCEA